MSLKAFHLIFIIASIIFTLLFGAWAVLNFEASIDTAEFILGVFSIFSSIGMIFYLIKFLKKYKNISYL
tara:strand:+ start:65 stop:271 length:207 start_codon:yes stop_codon:yes gene_type:complete